MSGGLVFLHNHSFLVPRETSLLLNTCNKNVSANNLKTNLAMSLSHQEKLLLRRSQPTPKTISHRKLSLQVAAAGEGVPSPPLDLTEDNIRQVLADARLELGVIFDTSIGITGQVELAELDGPFVKISLKGRFWHERSMVLARIGNYLKQRIPEILEVDIEDEKQLDDSPANF